MSLAIFGLFKALSPLFPTTPRRFAPADNVGITVQPFAASSSAAPRSRGGAAAHRTTGRPLRVTRLVDQGCATSCAGRMVMSGRFDDVCAELDRLVALESAREVSRTCH